MIPSLHGRFLARFDDLIEEGKSVDASREARTGAVTYGENWATQQRTRHQAPDYQVFDFGKCVAWFSKYSTLISHVLPQGNPNRELISKLQDSRSAIAENVGYFLSRLVAIRDDFASGFLDDAGLVIRGEVAADYLEQAEDLLKQGYFVAAAVLIGAVLEDGLRKLASTRNIAIVTADGKKKTNEPLNVDLQKDSAYGATKAAEIRAWAALRNSVAHGQIDGVQEADVKRMFEGVRSFISDYLR